MGMREAARSAFVRLYPLGSRATGSNAGFFSSMEGSGCGVEVGLHCGESSLEEDEDSL